tara:strand:+ start:532 stop:1035 length:504 start_codon:yes stop_codon:yes gene_type:complete
MEAHITTTKGTIKLNLFYNETPVTVSNFVNLANRGYYNDISFHRVIDNFMVQGGCPLGMGTGGPGYEFDDEFHPDLKHDTPGVLSMANAGPGTNGSQFFITHLETPWLDNHHTVFGKIMDDESQNIINSIIQGDKIEGIKIVGELPENDTIDNLIKSWNTILDKNNY